MAAAPNGIFPRNGVIAREAAPGALETANSTCDELFYAAKCTPRVDVQSLNTIISEIVAAVNCAGLTYDCSKLDNLCRAMRKLVEDGVCDTDTVATVASATVVLCTATGVKRITPDAFKTWLCSSSPIKTSIASTDYILSCTADGIRRINFSEILELIPDPEPNTDNYVDSADFQDGNLILGRTGTLPNIVTAAPLNWKPIAQGRIEGTDFVPNFPSVPGGEGNPGQASDLPPGVREAEASPSHGQNFYWWINTGVPMKTYLFDETTFGARYGFTEGYYRARVMVRGTVTAGVNGKPWGFEVMVEPITYWWGPHHLWIRVRPKTYPGQAGDVESIDVDYMEWVLEENVLGDQAPY